MGGSETAQTCIDDTREALVLSVATSIERGETPPAAAKGGERTKQVNIRLTAEEKAVLTAAAKSRGYRPGRLHESQGTRQRPRVDDVGGAVSSRRSFRFPVTSGILVLDITNTMVCFSDRWGSANSYPLVAYRQPAHGHAVFWMRKTT